MKYLTKDVSRLFSILAFISLVFFPLSSAFSAETSESRSLLDRESSVQELRERIDQAFQSIVIVIVYDITGEESARGSGFFFDADGGILTNASILKKAYSVEVISNKNRYSTVSVLKYDESSDTAIIKVDATNEPPLEMDFKQNSEINEKVIAIGRDDKFAKTLSEGFIKSIVQLDENRKLIKGTTVRPLLSFSPSDDGPLLNSEGKVIGLTSYRISDSDLMDNKTIMFDGQSINAISISSISDLIENPDTPSILQPKGSRVWWHWFKYRIKTAIISAFVFLYTLGFTNMMKYLLLSIVTLSIVQYIFKRIKKIFFKQRT